MTSNIREVEKKIQFSYDQVPYTSFSIKQAHINNLAVIASLYGMPVADIEHCRVLEMGCAKGGNLIPMALFLPQSEFLGIDLSPCQIQEGQDLIHRLDLKNIELKAMSILDLDESYGFFDYILVHGVYSWIPEEVQQKILDICHTNLAPHGIAYISYNTYPGWHIGEKIRTLIRYHIDHISDSQSRKQEVVKFLRLLLQKTSENLYREEVQWMQSILDAISENPSYFIHEYLEHYNQPLYFHEFAQQLEDHELQYLDDAFDMNMEAYAEIKKEIEKEFPACAKDLILEEQYLDFCVNRRFRQSLLCHAQSKIQRPPSAQYLKPEMYIASAMRPVAKEPDFTSWAMEEFSDDNNRIQVFNPFSKKALIYLSEIFPAHIQIQELTRIVTAQSYSGLMEKAKWHQDLEKFHQTLMLLKLLGSASLSMNKPPLEANVSQFPIASPLVRDQIRMNSMYATDTMHQKRKIEDKVVRLLLPYLDGTHTKEDLYPILSDFANKHQYLVLQNGEPSEDKAFIEASLRKTMDDTLAYLAYNAFLIG